MPTVPGSELPVPKSWDEFEDIVWDLYSREWNDPHAQRYGVSGQAQQGVDIYPITITNRLADAAVSGTVRLSVIDFEAETEMYSDTQDISVPASGSRAADMVWTPPMSQGATICLWGLYNPTEGGKRRFRST
jgi:hypothetical protein